MRRRAARLQTRARGPKPEAIRWLGVAACALLVMGTLAPAPASAWEVDPHADRQELEAFHEAFGPASHLFPRAPAEALGWTGFFVYGELAFQPDFDRQGIDGSLPGNGLGMARAGVRKGLPGGFDLGAAIGKAGSLDLLDAELQWTFVRGNAARPALAARLTAGRAESGDIYKLTRYGAELVVSKGIGPVTPFASAGVVRASGDFHPAAEPAFDVDDTQAVLSAGVKLNLLLPKLTISVEKADTVQATLRASFGF